MQDKPRGPDLIARDNFRVWTGLPIRYADLDTLGHVNNAAMAIYLEQARCDLIYPLLKTEGRSHLDIVLARITIDYLQELRYPGIVEVGGRVARLGTKSITLMHSVFAGERCVAMAEAVIVFFDLARRTSTEPPAEVRAALAKLM